MIAIRFVTYIITAQNIRLVHRSLFKSLYFITVALYIHHDWVYFITIKLSGDIEENPGPRSQPCNSLSICHWNLKSIPADNFIKLSLLRACISINVTLYAFLKPISTQVFHLIMAIWRYQGIL